MTEPATLTVRIGVLTYKRPDDIAAALPRLAEQVTAAGDDQTTIDILVVDNDPAASASTTVHAFADSHPEVKVWYQCEPTPGISAARNRVLDESRGRDVLIFIDDDERPCQNWLANLLATYRRERSAAVVGPVISEFETQPDTWVRAGRFFDRRRLPTGTVVDVAATNNLLLDLATIDRLGLRFDDQFGLSGGGDTMFTRTLHARGGTLVWCDEAVVIDIVPASRVTRDWVMRRALRSGSSWSATSIKLASASRARVGVRARLTGKGLARLAGGGARVVGGAATRSLSRRVRGMRTVARGAGMLLGAWGYVYAEYRRPQTK